MKKNACYNFDLESTPQIIKNTITVLNIFLFNLKSFPPVSTLCGGEIDYLTRQNHACAADGDDTERRASKQHLIDEDEELEDLLPPKISK